jgi:hypothetical protein
MDNVCIEVGMKVHDFGDTNTTYRYRVSIPSSNKTPLTELIEWLKENRIRCNIIPGFAYFHNECDVVHFMLRWS